MKHQFDLQYFAEDNTDSVDESAVTEKESSEPKKTDNLKYSDKDLDEILSKKFAKWQEKKQKEVDEAKKLAEMDAAQRAEYERNKLQEELNKLKKKDALFEMTKTARKMLQDKGINASEDLLSVLVTTDADKTKAAIDSFSTAFVISSAWMTRAAINGRLLSVKKGHVIFVHARFYLLLIKLNGFSFSDIPDAP